MTENQLNEIIESVHGLNSRIDYLEDELTTLRETIKQLENEILSLKNPFSKSHQMRG